MANTIEGKNISSKNAIRHGCCADTLILKSESQDDYNALEATWFQAYKPKSDAEKHLVQELVNADWFQQRATRTLADAEVRIMNEVENPLDWTAFMGYHLRCGNGGMGKVERERRVAAGRCWEDLLGNFSSCFGFFVQLRDVYP
jgi:hypothetical protein